MLISTLLSCASAALLLVGGLALLFGADVILPLLMPAFPAQGAWIGQLVAAGWLAVASLNWLSRSLLLGGIYGRPVVMSNAVLYFFTTTVLLEIVARRDAPAALWFLAAPSGLFAGIYLWLLLRGPLERDFELRRSAK